MTGDSTKPPLLLLHGWPGSFIEFEDPIAPLVTSIDPQIEAIISGSRLRYMKIKAGVSLAECNFMTIYELSNLLFELCFAVSRSWRTFSFRHRSNDCRRFAPGSD